MEDVHDEATREILANDQVEDVRENSPVEPNDQDVREVKNNDVAFDFFSHVAHCRSQIGKEDVASVVVPVVEVAVENSKVEISPDLTASSDPSLVEPSPPSDPHYKKIALLQQKNCNIRFRY
ncbi:putative WRKY transcription factor 32 [Raphanus sativus]|nr:putative WRKY transcription factor 32 [Raphanus sativus]